VHYRLSFKDQPKNKYLRALFDEAIAKKENFLNDRLYWLFFRGMGVADLDLEKQTKEELAEKRGDVPPLNGGLFEIEDQFDERAKVPLSNDAFASILNLFERYNFTVEESTPLDIQVAVDPEMLGKVFEELVTGRHETGSYYTPRPIVSFMCREALKHYLAGLQPSQEAVAKFVDEEDASELQNPERVLEALKRVRVCDPACGSGAYLLGMLHELTRLRAALFKSSKIDDATLYERKRWIIENNLYGVDNDKFAVQIACLRLWLSLAIESDQPHPLPNLDFKIECGDSLIAPAPSVAEKQMTFERTALVNEFRQTKADYMRENDPERKQKLRQRINELRAEIALALKHRVPRLMEGQIQKKRQQISLLEIDIERARNLSIKTQLEKRADELKRALAAHENAPKETDAGFDWAVEFAEVFVPPAREAWRMDGLHPLLNDFKLQGTLVEEAKPDTHSGGFDIVLANPPYLDSENMTRNTPQLRQLIQASYMMTRGNWDIYIAFYERGFDLLNTNGVLSFITPDKWISKPFGDEMRVRTTDKIFGILKAGRGVFRSVNVDAIVSLFRNTPEPFLRIYSFADGRIVLKRSISKDMLKSPYAYDWLFSEFLGLLVKISAHSGRLSNLGLCENACATSDAYKLKELIEEEPKHAKPAEYLRMINTGTIGKYVSKWGLREMVYLGDKYVRPVVNKKEFLRSFKNSYGRKAVKPKLIVKGLNLLDACLDSEGNTIPGKTTLMITTDHADDLKLLLAIVNSSIVFFYLKEKYPASSYNQGTTFTKLMINDMPIPEIASADRVKLVTFVDQILSAKRDNPAADATAWEHEIDHLVYKLYELTDGEIAIVESAASSTKSAMKLTPSPNKSRRSNAKSTKRSRSLRRPA
jgi:type I restriction-modification system DNA methylase subunit